MSLFYEVKSPKMMNPLRSEIESFIHHAKVLPSTKQRYQRVLDSFLWFLQEKTNTPLLP